MRNIYEKDRYLLGCERPSCFRDACRANIHPNFLFFGSAESCPCFARCWPATDCHLSHWRTRSSCFPILSGTKVRSARRGAKGISNYHLSFPMRSFVEATNSANTDVLERRFKLGMANGINFSTPFADKYLVIFCSNLPPEQRVRDGWNRFIVRKSFQDSMPAGIINRGGKFASTSSVKAQLRRALTPERQIEIIETCKVLDHIIEHKMLVGAVRRLTTPDTDVQLRDVISVWSSFSLARWMELFSVLG